MGLVTKELALVEDVLPVCPGMPGIFDALDRRQVKPSMS